MAYLFNWVVVTSSV